MRREEGHGGEDSYMNVCHQGNFALGVADGVYMWRTQVRPCSYPYYAPWAVCGVCLKLKPSGPRGVKCLAEASREMRGNPMHVVDADRVIGCLHCVELSKIPCVRRDLEGVYPNAGLFESHTEPWVCFP